MSFRKFPIPWKVVALTMIITASALLVSGVALAGYDYIQARSDLRSNEAALARTLAASLAAAVASGDRQAAADALNALQAEPSIVAECIYSGTALFIENIHGPGTTECLPELSTNASGSDSIQVSVPIKVKHRNIGTVQLRASLGPEYGRLRTEMEIQAAILLLSTLVALALSTRLHRLISTPILNLAHTADEISRSKDYSIRAGKETGDEVAILVDSFNEMLAQIQRRQGDLESANRTKDEFLAILSHELRTPLTSIFGWVNLMRQHKVDEQNTVKALEVIDRNVRAQIQLVDDLLNVSQMINGKLRIHPEWIPAGRIVRTAVDSIQPAAAAKGVPVVVDMADPSEQVYGDPQRIQQVLWNLLTNAVKFSNKGGEIRLKCGRAGAMFQFEISDQGEGIDEEFLPFIFQRFTQADASKTRKYGGLGLGLAIVRHIVESHGGTVMAYSQGKGQGARFTVDLPIP